MVMNERGEKKMGDRRLSDELPDERERSGMMGYWTKRIDAAMLCEGECRRIALSGIFTGIRDGIVACPVPMQS